ncbi:MAG TPA: hypothetical protein VJN18_30270 [Polyangiaceae bacterium]|nr:hypothetical protein [Polyangiaceae bacterium]
MLYLSLLFLHFLGLALGVGTSFAMIQLGAAARDLSQEERVKFMLRASAVGKNGGIGLGLLLLSGLGMLFVRGFSEVMAWGGPAFHAKLTLVVIFIGLFGYMQTVLKKVREAGGGPLMARLPKLGAALLAVGLLIMLTAVIAFK